MVSFMSGKEAVYRFSKRQRPIVRVQLENPHAPDVLPFGLPALIDTGADASVVPASLCPFLGHSFEKGLSESFTSGIGKGTGCEKD